MRSEAEQACRQRRGSEFLTKTSPTGRSLSLELAPSPYLPTSLIAHKTTNGNVHTLAFFVFEAR